MNSLMYNNNKLETSIIIYSLGWLKEQQSLKIAKPFHKLKLASEEFHRGLVVGKKIDQRSIIHYHIKTFLRVTIIPADFPTKLRLKVP